MVVKPTAHRLIPLFQIHIALGLLTRQLQRARNKIVIKRFSSSHSGVSGMRKNKAFVGPMLKKLSDKKSPGLIGRGYLRELVLLRL